MAVATAEEEVVKITLLLSPKEVKATHLSVDTMTLLELSRDAKVFDHGQGKDELILKVLRAIASATGGID